MEDFPSFAKDPDRLRVKKGKPLDLLFLDRDRRFRKGKAHFINVDKVVVLFFWGIIAICMDKTDRRFIRHKARFLPAFPEGPLQETFRLP